MLGFGLRFHAVSRLIKCSDRHALPVKARLMGHHQVAPVPGENVSSHGARERQSGYIRPTAI